MSDQGSKTELPKEVNKNEPAQTSQPGLDLVSLTKGSAKPEERKVQDDKAEAKSIGVASIDNEGTLHLRLRSNGNEGHFSYKKTDKQYAEILAHIGDIKPGEYKSVRPWPEQPEKK